MKNSALRIINLLMLLGGCFLVGTGFLIAWRLPPGSRGGRGLEFIGLDRHEWGDLHLYVAIGIIVLTILHLLLNRAWLRKIAAHNKKWPLFVGFGVALGIIAFFLFAPIESRPERGRGQHAEARHGP